ncbi:MAG TPA: beta-propeller fold lactonase family protein [Acidobacteriaceae bacterium]|jgi:6-phosphogluconolactonase (cycloisomerase 2 family)|nr:beta-propeller fold lactonase family protein [Acidobacteriaceae bacterium]
MTLSRIGRISRALVVSMAVVLGMSACGGYTVGFMWVLGTQYNQIAGFKIDDYTGNLTSMVNSPYPSAGTDPVSITVRVGGNFVFVVNKGTLNSKGVSNGDGNVAVFAVGEDGILTFQNTYQTAGNAPVWATTDGTGTYLYVLDSQAPDYATTGNGDITVFGIDGSTGRLQLIPNQLIKNSAGQQLNYFEVGKAPTTFRVGGTCLYALDSGDQTIYPYGLGGNGQLTIEVNSTIPLGTVNATSINIFGSSVYITDAGSSLSTGGAILPYSTGASCSLSVQADGAVANLPLTSNPVYSMTDSKNRFLYVLNHGGTNSNNPNSTISAYVIESTGQLQPISDPNNPYPVGNGPTCMVEDPSSQYLFTSNSNDGTVTGKFLNQNTGQLSDLTRGSSFTAFAAQATCLAVSGNVD